MSKISATIVADSKDKNSNRITSVLVTFPRFILAELNTHRMFSRNSASSRAIPFEKMLQSVMDNPFIPIAWQKDHKGMQGTEYITGEVEKSLVINHLRARDYAVLYAKANAGFGATKQLCNRLLEPFMWHTVLITATEWENFFALRCPRYELTDQNKHVFFTRSKRDFLQKLGSEGYLWGKKRTDLTETDWLLHNKGQAEIHMMALAEAIWDAMNESTPKELKPGEWHIPFGDKINLSQLDDIIADDLGGLDTDLREFEEQIANKRNDYLIKVATARCARVSYIVVGEEGKPDDYKADIALHDRLKASGHWSPFEHCAKCMNGQEWLNSSFNADDGEDGTWGWSGNFRGFIQYRKMFAHENITVNNHD